MEVGVIPGITPTFGPFHTHLRFLWRECFFWLSLFCNILYKVTESYITVLSGLFRVEYISVSEYEGEADGQFCSSYSITLGDQQWCRCPYIRLLYTVKTPLF